MDDDVRDEDYRRLARFRHELRRFLRFSEEAAKAAGLTAQHYQALLAIRAGPEDGMPVGELADQMLLKPHSMTGLVDRLAQAGLVARVRGDGDRRQVRVVATDQARDLLVSLAANHRAELRRLKPMLGELIASL
ncbi:MarR family transcriptional regulator [Sphingomonas koreensis]|nr:MarR family transcriptional regulator [Sphingomonas koreensis]